MNPGPQTGAHPEVEAYYRHLWTEMSSRDLHREDLARWRAIEAFLRQTLDKISDTRAGEGLRILDLGCGRGWITQLLAEIVGSQNVEGVDPLVSSVEAARERYPALSFRQATGMDLLAAGEAGSRDLIICSEVIEHVPQARQQNFLADAFELLRPGGFLILTTPRGELWKRWRAAGGRPQPVDDWIPEDTLVQVVQKAGFQLIACRRAYVPKRPLTWQGWLEKWVLGRRIIRTFPLKGIRSRLRDAARLYQVLLLKKAQAVDGSVSLPEKMGELGLPAPQGVKGGPNE